ncbi:uncharacterized protein RBU33_005784 isoform 2-T2 [Hipposideros larvatus]
MQPRKAGIATTVISGPSPPPRAWAALLAVGELGLCRPGVPRGHHLNISRKCAESLLYARPCTRCWGNSGRTKPDKNDLGQRSLGALPQMKTTEGARNRESWGRPGTASVAIREIISRLSKAGFSSADQGRAGTGWICWLSSDVMAWKSHFKQGNPDVHGDPGNAESGSDLLSSWSLWVQRKEPICSEAHGESNDLERAADWKLPGKMKKISHTPPPL